MQINYFIRKQGFSSKIKRKRKQGFDLSYKDVLAIMKYIISWLLIFILSERKHQLKKGNMDPIAASSPFRWDLRSGIYHFIFFSDTKSLFKPNTSEIYLIWWQSDGFDLSCLFSCCKRFSWAGNKLQKL